MLGLCDYSHLHRATKFISVSRPVEEPPYGEADLLPRLLQGTACEQLELLAHLSMADLQVLSQVIEDLRPVMSSSFTPALIMI